MTTTTPHGQVPEALIDPIDAYAETRHRCGGIYNARTEAARNAVIEALSGVQALSAAPEAFLKSVIALCSHRGYSPANIEAWDKDDKWIADLWRQAESMLAASPTPPAEQTFITPETGNSASAKGAAITSESGTPTAEQQAQPGAVDRTGCTAGTDEECTRRGCATSCPAQQAAPKAAPQQEAQEPVAWLNPWRADQVTTDYDAYGERGIPLYTAPQPSPTAQSADSVQKDAARYRWLRATTNYVTSNGERIDVRNMPEKWDSAIDAAIAAQGGK